MAFLHEVLSDMQNCKSFQRSLWVLSVTWKSVHWKSVSSHIFNPPLHCFMSWWKTCLYILSLGIVGSGLRQASSPGSGLLQFANANPTSSEQLVWKNKKIASNNKKNPNRFYTLVEYFAKKIIFLHSCSRPFSEVLGHGHHMCCLLEIEKEKNLSKLGAEFMSRSCGFMGTWQIYGWSVIIQLSKVLLNALVSHWTFFCLT